MKKFLSFIMVLLLVVSSGFILFKYWPYIFSKNISGVITDVQRVTQPAFVVGGTDSVASSTALFSFAIAIRQQDGIIATASSEDRQWAVAQRGQCVEAKFYPYPPWEFDKAGTYFNARLTKLFVCDEGKIIPTETNNSSAAPEGSSH